MMRIMARWMNRRRFWRSADRSGLRYPSDTAPPIRTGIYTNLLLLPPFHPLPSGTLSRAWSRSSACRWIVRSPQVPDGCRRTILGRAIAPATAALQHVHNAADDAAIVHPLDAPDICRQLRFDPLPLFIA